MAAMHGFAISSYSSYLLMQQVWMLGLNLTVNEAMTADRSPYLNLFADPSLVRERQSHPSLAGVERTISVCGGLFTVPNLNAFLRRAEGSVYDEGIWRNVWIFFGCLRPQSLLRYRHHSRDLLSFPRAEGVRPQHPSPVGGRPPRQENPHHHHQTGESCRRGGKGGCRECDWDGDGNKHDRGFLRGVHGFLRRLGAGVKAQGYRYSRVAQESNDQSLLEAEDSGDELVQLPDHLRV